MPKTLKDEEGNDIEVETAEEVQARIESERQEAAEAAKAEAEAAIAEKETALAEAQEKLKKFEDKDYNFNKLRNKTEKGEAELKATIDKLSQDVESLKGFPSQQQRILR